MRTLVVGSANLDYVIRVKSVPGAGETVIGEGFAAYPGGKGANQALACSRAGCPTSLLAKIGREPEAEILLESLSRGGVDLDLLIRSEDPTGRAFIVVDDSGENRIVVASGANATLSPKQLEETWPTDWVPDAVLLQLEIPVDTVAKALELAGRCGALTVLNPAPSRGALPAELLSMVDYLVPNRTEATALAARPFEGREHVLEGARELASLVGRGVIVTLGADGALAARKEGEYQCAAPGVEAVDTTAAGDTFCGYVVAGLVERLSLPDAVRRAVVAASLACTRPGAQDSVPTRGEVDQFLQVLERRRRWQRYDP